MADFDLPTPEEQRINAGELYCVGMRIPAEMLEQIDEIVKMSIGVEFKGLSRAAVVRAGMAMWLKIAKHTDPALVIDAVRKAHIRSGRKKL